MDMLYGWGVWSHIRDFISCFPVDVGARRGGRVVKRGLVMFLSPCECLFQALNCYACVSLKLELLCSTRLVVGPVDWAMLHSYAAQSIFQSIKVQ